MTTRNRRKDRILNTRIPADLDRELREQAERLDMPVSELVRGMLTRTVDLLGNLTGNVEHLVNDIVEDVSAFGSGLVPGATAGRDPVRAAVDQVVGWQQIRIHQPTQCALTGVELKRGASAQLGISDEGKPAVIISDEALETLLAESSKEPPMVAITLTRAVTCGVTGREMQPGERAWFRPGAQPAVFVSDEAHDNEEAP